MRSSRGSRESFSSQRSSLSRAERSPSSPKRRDSRSTNALTPNFCAKRRSSPTDAACSFRSTKWTLMRRSAKKRSAARVSALLRTPKSEPPRAVLVGGGEDLDGADQMARAKPRFGVAGREVPERGDGPEGHQAQAFDPGGVPNTVDVDDQLGLVALHHSRRPAAHDPGRPQLAHGVIRRRSVGAGQLFGQDDVGVVTGGRVAPSRRIRAGAGGQRENAGGGDREFQPHQASLYSSLPARCHES